MPSYPLLDDDYLARLVDHYVAAAKLAHRAGFQFVDIKQCHHYLLNELLGARSRPGRYGGSYENRTRLARDIVSAIRAAVPGLTLIATRINVFDGVPYAKGPDGRGVPCDSSAAGRRWLGDRLERSAAARPDGAAAVHRRIAATRRRAW